MKPKYASNMIDVGIFFQFAYFLSPKNPNSNNKYKKILQKPIAKNLTEKRTNQIGWERKDEGIEGGGRLHYWDVII